MTTERLNELAKEISTWSARNFPVRESRLGIIEEIGEAAHCLLKRKQGIRGFDNEEYFKEQLADALADTAIYLLDYAGQEDISLNALVAMEGQVRMGDRNQMEMIGSASHLAYRICDRDREIANGGYDSTPMFLSSLIGVLAEIGRSTSIDFYAKLEETWAKVSKRDWVLNPKDANVVAETA